MTRLLAGLLLAATAGCAHAAPAKPGVAMWRLDCGTFDIDNLEGRGRVIMPTSCYLIRHGDELVLFDAGMEARLYRNAVRGNGQTLRMGRTLAQQLVELKIDPAKVGTLVVSHYHGDHNGQADLFPNAKLVIGAADAAALRGESDQGKLGPWLKGERPVEEISQDHDLTGDGSLRVLFTPGHTPGHLSMLVKLKGGNYVLTGDLVHLRRQLATREPSGNHVDKVRGKAEIERVIALAKAEHATIIVGHERDDVGLLPTFPKAAE